MSRFARIWVLRAPCRDAVAGGAADLAATEAQAWIRFAPGADHARMRADGWRVGLEDNIGQGLGPCFHPEGRPPRLTPRLPAG